MAEEIRRKETAMTLKPQPHALSPRKNPLIGKTIKSISCAKDSDGAPMAHLRIEFTDSSSVSFTAHAPEPDWDDAAYWDNDGADAINIELETEEE